MTALESGELNSQHERELRHSEGSGMLIGDPHGEGSNTSSTNKESNLSQRTENSILRMNEMELRCPEGNSMLIGEQC